MTLAHPWMLVLLLLPLLILCGTWFASRRRLKDSIRFSDGGLLEELRLTPVSPWRRRVPIAGLVVSLTLMVLAAADPQRMGPVESSTSTVVLALDVSRSMLAEDVAPTRIEAARLAAIEFINAAPPRARIGLVAFSSRVDILSVPTTDRSLLTAAAANLQPDGGTAIGDAIFTSLSLLDTKGWVPDPADPTRSVQTRAGAIVVMSDGSTNSGRPDADAAAAAKLAGVPVYTVAFGTSRGVISVNGTPIEVPAEPEPLRAIASETAADSYEATTGGELSRVFATLAGSVAVEEGLRSFAHVIALLATLILFATAAAWVRFGARI